MDGVRIRDFHNHVDEEVIVRGWLHNKRSSGKLRFLTVRDGSGYAQAVVSKKAVPPGRSRVVARGDGPGTAG